MVYSLLGVSFPEREGKGDRPQGRWKGFPSGAASLCTQMHMVTPGPMGSPSTIQMMNMTVMVDSSTME